MNVASELMRINHVALHVMGRVLIYSEILILLSTHYLWNRTVTIRRVNRTVTIKRVNRTLTIKRVIRTVTIKRVNMLKRK